MTESADQLGYGSRLDAINIESFVYNQKYEQRIDESGI
jgi:hypothetical protein